MLEKDQDTRMRNQQNAVKSATRHIHSVNFVLSKQSKPDNIVGIPDMSLKQQRRRGSGRSEERYDMKRS